MVFKYAMTCQKMILLTGHRSQSIVCVAENEHRDNSRQLLLYDPKSISRIHARFKNMLRISERLIYIISGSNPIYAMLTFFNPSLMCGSCFYYILHAAVFPYLHSAAGIIICRNALQFISQLPQLRISATNYCPK